MCRIVKEKVEFPFPDLPGTLPAPGVVGELVIHNNGMWTFETVEGREALSYFIHYPAGGGDPVVEVEFSGEVPEGVTSQYTEEYPRL